MAYNLPKKLIEDFERRFPWLYRYLEEWENRSNDEVLITLSDGRYIIYNEDHFPYEIKFFASPMSLKEEEWRKDFGRRLDKIIKQSPLHKYEVAARIDVTPAMLSRYTAGEVTPSAFILNKLAYILDCPMEEIVPYEYVITNR